MDTIRPYDGMTTLEQLNLFRNLHYCEGLANERGIIANAINDILVQFNRQKAENETLRKNNKAVMQTIADVHTEAVKEFAERLKSEMIKSKYMLTVSPYSRACNAVISFWADEIDNLVKEMVGDA